MVNIEFLKEGTQCDRFQFFMRRLAMQWCEDRSLMGMGQVLMRSN